MAGHAQLKLIMTECSKTQIRLTGHIYGTSMWSHLKPHAASCMISNESNVTPKLIFDIVNKYLFSLGRNRINKLSHQTRYMFALFAAF